MEKMKKSNILVIMLFVFSVLIFLFAIWFYNQEDVVQEPQRSEKVRAVATIFPIYDILREVGGDRIDATLLLTPGASPHNFEASPKDIKELDKTNLFLFAGAGVDFWANDLVTDNVNQGRADYIAIDMSSIVELRPFSNVKFDDGEDINKVDVLFIEPQLDPKIALAMAQGIVNNFVILDPLGGLDERNSYIDLVDYNVK